METTWERGLRGERVASEHLTGLGWRVVAHNVRYRVGEIDIVAHDGRQWVFVEVRTRYAPARIRAEDTVRLKKQWRLGRAARLWLRQHAGPQESARFDVIAVDGRRGIVIAHHRGAFEAPGL